MAETTELDDMSKSSQSINKSQNNKTLIDIDCMLTQFESSFEKENIEKKDLIINNLKTNPILTDSPLLTNDQSKLKNKTNSLLLLHKKSKSFYNLQSCSTPKIIIDKELEYLNVLHESGYLNDNSQPTTNSPKITSPIIRSSAMSQIANQETPKTDNDENLIRKIKFDDELQNDLKDFQKKFSNKLETVEEDEELIAHLNKSESITSNLNQIGFKNTIVNNNNSIKKETLEDALNNFQNDSNLTYQSEIKLESNCELSGFQTASGKSLSYKKDKVLQEKTDQASVFEPYNKNNITEMSGFQTASGKSLLYKKDKIFRDEEETNPISNNELSGFQTASGKDLLYKKDKILNIDNDSKHQSSTEISGFQTASGKNLLYKKDKILQDDSNDSVNVSGFQTASGKNLLHKKDKILCDEQDISSSLNNEMSGFQTASGKGLLYRKDKILKEETDTKRQEPTTEISGFQTASGKNLLYKKDKIIQDDLNDSVDVSGFQTASGKNLLYKKDKILNEENEVQQKSSTVSGFQTAGGKNLFYNREKILNDNLDSNEMEIKMDIDIKQNERKSIINQDSFKNQTITENFQRPQKNNTAKMMDGKKFKKPQLMDRTKLNKYVDSIMLNKTDISICINQSDYSIDQSTIEPDVKKENEIIETNNYHVFKSLKTQSTYLKIKDINIIKNKDSSKTEKQRINLINFHDGSTNCEKENEFYLVKPTFELLKCETIYPQIKESKTASQNLSENNYEIKRQNAMGNLNKRIELKKSISLKPIERTKQGFWSELKSLNINKRISLKNFKLYQETTQINNQSDDLNDLKFNLAEFSDLNCLIKTNGFFITKDGGCLISDKDLNIGINEIYNCFIDSNGVDLKLIDFNWFENHYKWIVLKLNSYDLKLSNHLNESKSLNPLNILYQLKYRYDIEIGNARRSSIRKIVEKDDTSINKTLILFVSKIFPSNNSSSNLLYIELCDGWYPIKALCDSYLSEYVKKNKIKIGDKLAIFSSELVGCPKDGCPPLEAPDEMYLKLSVNSTRKVKWYSKLGYLKPHKPLIIPLETIKPNSIVGAVDVVVERIYPILFMEKKSDGSKIYRNQKQEELFDYNHQNDFEIKLSSKLGNNIDDSDYDKSLDKFDSNETIKSNHSFNNDRKSGSFIQKRDVNQILKLRIRNSFINKNNREQITCLITIWQNANELYEKLNEGQRLLFFNLNSIIQKNFNQETSAVCLGTNRMTFYKTKKQINYMTSRQHADYENLYEGKISSSFNEIDTCGIVLKHSTNNYNNLVYLTNLNEANSIICIGFPKNSDFYGFKDILKYSNSVACLNLKYTLKKENYKYPYLIASEITIFTQKVSSYKFLLNEFNLLNQSINKQESKNRLSDLVNDIENQSFAKPVNNFKLNNSYQTLNQKTNKNEIINDTKESKLASIVQAAEVVPIQLKNGLKQPGLAAKVRPFMSPMINRVNENNKNSQLKRRSDTFSYISNNTSNISVSNTEEEDSFIINYDLEAMCKNKRVKKD